MLTTQLLDGCTYHIIIYVQVQGVVKFNQDISNICNSIYSFLPSALQMHKCKELIYVTRSRGALRALSSRWRPFGPLDFVLRALWALRPCDPRVGDWIVC